MMIMAMMMRTICGEFCFVFMVRFFFRNHPMTWMNKRKEGVRRNFSESETTVIRIPTLVTGGQIYFK